MKNTTNLPQYSLSKSPKLSLWREEGRMWLEKKEEDGQLLEGERWSWSGDCKQGFMREGSTGQIKII